MNKINKRSQGFYQRMNIFSITMTSVSPPYDDGPKNIVFAVAERLKRHNFIFISSFKSQFDPHDNIMFIRSPFQNKSRLRMSFLQQSFIFMTILFNLNRIDIFQFFFTPRRYFSIIFKYLMKGFNKKSIQVVSSVYSLYNKNTTKDVKSLFFSDKTIVHSDYAKRKLESEGIENIVRIYPGVDFSRFNKDNYKQNYFWAQGKNGNVHVIYPAAYRVLMSSYSYADFCNIILLAKDKIKEAKFVMAGKIRERSDLRFEAEFKDIAKEYGIEDEIIFLNTVDDMPTLLNSCDIVIFPSKREALGILEIPLGLLEASALEKPIIYSDISPLNELKECGIGVCLDNASAKSYANAIIDLLGDRDKSSKIGSLSKAAVSKDFNMDKAALEYGAIYDSLR